MNRVAKKAQKFSDRHQDYKIVGLNFGYEMGYFQALEDVENVIKDLIDTLEPHIKVTSKFYGDASCATLRKVLREINQLGESDK